MQIDGVKTASFEDEAIVVSGISHPYRNIRRLRWRATVTQNSINGIPTGKSYDATLSFFTEEAGATSVFGDNGFWGSLNKKGFEALARVGEILSELTFTYRIRRYEQFIQEKQYFPYGQYQFHKSGDIFSDGQLLFNIHEAQNVRKIDTFTLAMRPPKAPGKLWKNLFQSEVSIDISTDKDCLLYMFRSVYGIYFGDERIRQKRRDRKSLFYESAIAMGALIASADGDAAKAELNTLREYFSIDTAEFPDAGKIYNEQLQHPRSVSQILTEFADEFQDEFELKETFLFGMGMVAMADGVLHDQEAKILSDIAYVLGISASHANRILATLNISFGHGGDQNQGYNQYGASSYYAVLGLQQSATLDEVKIAYRTLVRRYHPDVLRSQNLPDEQLASAEQMMREINTAYEWIAQNR